MQNVATLRVVRQSSKAKKRNFRCFKIVEIFLRSDIIENYLNISNIILKTFIRNNQLPQQYFLLVVVVVTVI